MKKSVKISIGILAIIGAISAFVILCTAESDDPFQIKILWTAVGVLIIVFGIAMIIDRPTRVTRLFVATAICFGAFAYSKLHINNKSYKKCYKLKRQSGSYIDLFHDISDAWVDSHRGSYGFFYD